MYMTSNGSENDQLLTKKSNGEHLCEYIIVTEATVRPFEWLADAHILGSYLR